MSGRLGAALLILALAPAGHAQVRDLGTFGIICPVPPRAAPPAAVGLTLPQFSAAAPSLGRAPGLPLAVRRERREFARPGGWPAGAPRVVAVVGEDPGSDAVVRSLPAGAVVLVLPPARPETLARLRSACPGCVVGPSGAGAATALGVRAYPAVVRWTGAALEIVEGEP